MLKYVEVFYLYWVLNSWANPEIMIFSQFSLFLIVWKGHVLLILRRTYSYDILLKIDCHTKVAIEQQNAVFFNFMSLYLLDWE